MSTGNMERVLRLMAEKNASDVYLSANTPILIRINGQILQLSDQVLAPQQIRQLLGELLTPQQFEEFDGTGELNLAIGLPGIGSFRMSAFRQRGTMAAVVVSLLIGLWALLKPRGETPHVASSEEVSAARTVAQISPATYAP